MKSKYYKLKNGGVLIHNADIEADLKNFENCAIEKDESVKDCGIIAPVFFDDKGKIFFHGGYITTKTYMPMPFASGEEDIGQFDEFRPVQITPLYLAYISPKLVKRLPPPKGLGENPFEDSDYCLQAKEMGYKTYINKYPSAIKKTTYENETELPKAKEKLQKQYTKFQKKWDKYINAQTSMPVVLHSHVGFPGGYNVHARKLAQALVENGLKLYYAFIGGGNPDEPVTNNFMVDDLRNDMGSMRMPQITLGTGLLLFKNSGDYKIGFTTTEVDGIPKDWVKVLNEMDEVWTTAEFCVKVFKKSGVKVPIYNMGEGVDPAYYNPDIKEFLFTPHKGFTFVSNFAWGKRKGVDVLFKAFQDEFSEKEDVQLVCNCLPSYQGHDILQEIKNLKLRDDRANITVIDRKLEDYEMPQFYTAGNCYVMPTRGEGFGLPLLEALACGLPIISTNCTGQIDFLKKNGKELPGVHLIKTKKELYDGSDSVYYYGFNWHKPDLMDLRKKMRYVFENAMEEKEKALKSSEYIRQNWNWDIAAKKVIKRIKEIYEERKICKK